MSKNTGGPAFPNEGANTPDYPIYDGMTLRDYFAAKAMQGVIATLAAPLVHEQCAGDFGRYAGIAYRLADAMLAERENQS